MCALLCVSIVLAKSVRSGQVEQSITTIKDTHDQVPFLLFLIFLATTKRINNGGMTDGRVRFNYYKTKTKRNQSINTRLFSAVW